MTCQLIVVGASLGGLHALEVLLGGLPTNFPVPIAIVQHRHKTSDNKLRVILQQHTGLVVMEPQDKEEIVPGYIYVAPADYHLMVEAKSDTVPYPYFSLSIDAPVTYSRPSIDVLFETAADAYAEKLLGVLLTGANQDGTEGMKKIKVRGGKTVVEEPSTAVCPTMPQAAIAAGVVDKVLPLVEIAPFLLKICTF
ncbi:chemotaxis protein CheB [Mastigocladopsis repens]|uniref:chemotaxis protein CheB n=1 Tax=Mastigocladopsis repens TaxID=221287 RepID=UPI00031F2875|nr:chemotaxis protein CheB [Mastigocladopsis repens]